MHGKKSSRYHMEARRSKALYLPMPRAEVEPVILRFRMALETLRAGHADRSTVNHLATVLLLTRFLSEAGHGLLDQAVLDDAEKTLGDVIKAGNETDVWTIGQPVIDILTVLVNEHDRQLCETRLQAIAEASRRLDRYFEKLGKD
ncbi:hypothetical protein PQR65_38740 [Paraburkholderia nemoris]|uniref:hypothetical protein n=1 Tax=Paraburkholderia nemoris TaxID=2793076 RepID=UPI0038B93F0A